MLLFEWKQCHISLKWQFFHPTPLFEWKKCHSMTFSWPLETQITRARGKRNHKLRTWMLFQKGCLHFVFWLSPRGESTANNIFQHNCFPAVWTPNDWGKITCLSIFTAFIFRQISQKHLCCNSNFSITNLSCIIMPEFQNKGKG